jgi:hypothetical protein
VSTNHNSITPPLSLLPLMSSISFTNHNQPKLSYPAVALNPFHYSPPPVPGIGFGVCTELALQSTYFMVFVIISAQRWSSLNCRDQQPPYVYLGQLGGTSLCIHPSDPDRPCRSLLVQHCGSAAIPYLISPN